MDIALVETQVLIDELRNRFKAFIFSGVISDCPDEEMQEANLYVYHGGAVFGVGLCRLMERALMGRRVEMEYEEM